MKENPFKFLIKIFFVFVLLLGIVGEIFAKAHIKITFLNGDVVENTAESWWTNYCEHDGYYEFYEDDQEGKKNPLYYCVADYVCMNPVSRETKKDDFRHIRDKVEAQGHWCHYYDKQGTLSDQYGISLKWEEILTVDCQK